MAAMATPTRSLLGRLVGSLSQYVPTPLRTAASDNGSSQESPPNSDPTYAASPTESPAAPPPPPPAPAPEPWHPGMIQSKYLLEMENMFDEINKTPRRRPVRRPQTCPPKRRSIRANVVDMPRSAMKKRSAPIDEEGPDTPSNNKRVKFNDNLTQEHILSPSQPGERDCVSESPFTSGKKRPRATEPYAGRHFADIPNIFDVESSSKRARYDTGDDSVSDSSNIAITQNNTIMNVEIGGKDDESFVPNRAQPRPGTFELNYDTYGLGDDSSLFSEEENSTQVEAQPTTYNPPSASTTPGRFALEFSDDSILPDSSSLPNDITPTPGPSKPPIQATSPPALEPSTTQNEEEISQLEATDDTPPTPPKPPNAAAIDAEIDALPWPAPVTYVEAGIASQYIIDLLNERYDAEDEYYAQRWWDREFSKFSKALTSAKAEGRMLQIEL